jgi:hypothetical protein
MPLKRLMEDQPVEDALRIISFVTIALLYRLAEIFSLILPVRISWLVFQFAATWAASFVITRLAKQNSATPAPSPNLATVQGLVGLFAITLVLAFWLSFALGLWHFILSPFPRAYTGLVYFQRKYRMGCQRLGARLGRTFGSVCANPTPGHRFYGLALRAFTVCGRCFPYSTLMGIHRNHETLLTRVCEECLVYHRQRHIRKTSQHDFVPPR